MTARGLALWCVALCSFALPALGDEVVAPSDAYRAVMRAQLAARQPPAPMRPEEAQKIYDTYLQSLGRPKERAGQSSDDSTMPSH